jgi:hypothetical protein
MSNSEPSAIVPQCIPCMRGLYIDSNGENQHFVLNHVLDVRQICVRLAFCAGYFSDVYWFPSSVFFMFVSAFWRLENGEPGEKQTQPSAVRSHLQPALSDRRSPLDPTRPQAPILSNAPPPLQRPILSLLTMQSRCVFLREVADALDLPVKVDLRFAKNKRIAATENDNRRAHRPAANARPLPRGSASRVGLILDSVVICAQLPAEAASRK